MLLNALVRESTLTFLAGLILSLLFIIFRGRHWQLEMNEYEAQIDKLNSSSKKKNTQMKNLMKSLKEYEVNIEDISSQLRHSEEENHSLTNKVNELVQYVTDLKDVVNKRDVLILDLKALIEKAEKINGELAVSLKKRDKDLKYLYSHAEKQKETINQMNDQANEMTEQIQSLTTHVEERGRTVSQLQDMMNNRDNHIQELLALSEQAHIRISELDILFKEKEQEVFILEARMRAMQDNLTTISGIGPKVSAVLRSAGITSFSKLAAAKIGKIKKILKEENPSLLQLLDPTTWSKQAKLATSGNWEALRDLQDSLKGKRREEIDALADTKVDQITQDIPVSS